MSWISRLLTHSPSLQHRASNSRLRRDKNFRRRLTMESLESRVVLSNVAVVYDPTTLALTITGDQFNDGIRIVENATTAAINPGGVSVSGIITAQGATTINNTPVAFTSPGVVKTIAANFTAGGVTSFDKIFLTGPGKAVATTVTNVTINVGTANLGLSVNAVDNNGAFTLTSLGNINGPGTTPAQINNPTVVTGPATIDNSTFTSLSITQVSETCVALVELGSDTISGTVNVSLGNAPGDQIILGAAAATPTVSDVFGATTLSTGNGAGDVINVGTLNGPRIRLRSLSITEGNGANDRINVQFLTLTSPLGPGVTTLQGNGNTDQTVVNSVLAPLGTPPLNIPGGTSSLAGISVTQGNGLTDTATVSNSTLPGNVSITQGNGGNTANNGPGDTATVSGVTLIVNPFVQGNISITQGNGNAASASVLASSVPGNISITQGNGGPAGPGFTGPGDTALVSGSTALGDVHFNADGDAISVTGGNITVIQGNGNSDTSTVTGSRAGGNITITQSVGPGPGFAPVAGGNGDTINLLGTTAGFTQVTNGFPTEIGGDVTIVQGNGASNTVNLNSTGAGATLVNNSFNNVSITQGNATGTPVQGSALASDVVHVNDTFITSNLVITQGTAAAAGGYLITIGDTSPVTVGGFTVITQNGAGNAIVLGGAGTAADFTTAFLDIFMGNGGGAFITASSTNVLIGSIGSFVINAGSFGNTFFDLGGNSGLNASGNFNSI